MGRTAPCRSVAALKSILARLSAGRYPDFRAEISERIQAEQNTIVVQPGWRKMPSRCPCLVKKGEGGRIAHADIIRYNADGKISRLACYWDNTARNAIRERSVSILASTKGEGAG